MFENKWYEDIVGQINSIPVLDVINHYTPLRGLERTGRGYKAFCCLQDGRDKDFHIDISGNYWTCFKCNRTSAEATKQNAISYVMQCYGISFSEAVVKIKEDFGLTSAHTMPKIKNKTYTPKKRVAAPITRTVVEDKVAPIRTLEERHMVYKMFLNVAGLTRAHLKMLMTERYLTKQQIVSSMYASYPTRTILPELFKSLEEKGLPKDILLGVPGFYKDLRGNLTFDELKDYAGNPKTAILIPITDQNGYIQGLQIRFDKVDTLANGKKGLRYLFFSSAKYCSEGNKGLWGCGPGSPIGVVYPKSLQTKCVFITEGRFKAEVLSRKMGAVVIYVQGVSSVKEIDSIVCNVMDALQKCNLTANHIIMAFDADSFKYSVYMALKNVSTMLINCLPEIKLNYLVWNPSHGKGIDDLINGNPDTCMTYLRVVNKKEWDDKYLQCYHSALMNIFTFDESEFLSLYGYTPKEVLLIYVKWKTSEDTEDINKYMEFFSELKKQENEKQITYVINEYVSSMLFADIN